MRGGPGLGAISHLLALLCFAYQVLQLLHLCSDAAIGDMGTFHVHARSTRGRHAPTYIIIMGPQCFQETCYAKHLLLLHGFSEWLTD